jgi:hypothetical protein
MRGRANIVLVRITRIGGDLFAPAHPARDQIFPPDAVVECNLSFAEPEAMTCGVISNHFRVKRVSQNKKGRSAMLLP